MPCFVNRNILRYVLVCEEMTFEMDVFWMALLSVGVSMGHELARLDVPVYADPRRPAELGCFYTRTPEDPPLHSVKWYRDAHEIFRYMPLQKPQTLEFSESGVSVESSSCDESQCIISFRPPRSLALTAAYTCEVSTEGPRFEVAKRTKQMTVAALPASDPVISGVPRSAYPGEELQLNCTSDYSLPPADITWYINDEPVTSSEGAVSAPDAEGLRASWRAVRVRASLAEAGGAGAGSGTGRAAMLLRCEATLSLQPPHSRRALVLLPLHTSPHISKLQANGSTTSMHKTEYINLSLFVVSVIYAVLRRL